MSPNAPGKLGARVRPETARCSARTVGRQAGGPVLHVQPVGTPPLLHSRHWWAPSCTVAGRRAFRRAASDDVTLNAPELVDAVRHGRDPERQRNPAVWLPNPRLVTQAAVIGPPTTVQMADRPRRTSRTGRVRQPERAMQGLCRDECGQGSAPLAARRGDPEQLNQRGVCEMT